ncbi:MAG: hypothetical protein RLZ12_1008, partial [Bacillota bacterium]
MEAVIRPYVDAVFKHIFGSEANKETVLRSFLNDLLKKTEPVPIKELTLLNSNLAKKYEYDKLSVLDIAART